MAKKATTKQEQTEQKGQKEQKEAAHQSSHHSSAKGSVSDHGAQATASTAQHAGHDASAAHGGKEDHAAHAANDDAHLREEYAALAKKYQLPPFDELNDEFDIDTIDAYTKHLAKETAKKMFERIDLFRKILEGYLSPESSILAMQEAEFLNEQEQNKIARLLRTLMRIDRTLLLLELENKEEGYATFIIDAHKEWSSTKHDLLPLISAMRAGWNKPDTAKKSQQYLG